MMSQRKKKKRKFKTPMEMTAELKAIGESYSKYGKLLAYASIIAVAVVIGLLFQLPTWMIVVCCIVYIVMTPKLLYNYKKQRYEKQKFDDACAYLSQMNQSFTSTHNILESLRETQSTFTEGKMRTTLQNAIDRIENSYTNVRLAEEEALAEISREYDCEKTRTLHDYLIRAEARGGDCTEEFKIIDRINGVWKSAILDHYKRMIGFRNMAALYFGLLLAVCVYLLRSIPDVVDLMGNGIVQFTNMTEIILFIVVVAFTDGKLNHSLLRDAKYMSEASARSASEYISQFDGKKERKKYLPVIILATVLCAAFFVLKPSAWRAVLGIGFFLLVFNMHKLIYYLNWMMLKSEMTKAFPKWLFDVFLLMQTESVEASIFYSREYAPPVLITELERICDYLMESPGNPEAYMSFLAEFRIEGVENAMRNLYSMAVGIGNREVMKASIEQSMVLLSKAEKAAIKNKGDITTVYQYIPLIFMTLGMIAYLAALIMEVFAKLGGTISL